MCLGFISGGEVHSPASTLQNPLVTLPVSQNNRATIAFFHYRQAVKMKIAEASYPHNHHQKRITIPFLRSRASIHPERQIAIQHSSNYSSIEEEHYTVALALVVTLPLTGCGDGDDHRQNPQQRKGLASSLLLLVSCVVEPRNLWSFLCLPSQQQQQQQRTSKYRMPFLGCYFRKLNEVHFTCFLSLLCLELSMVHFYSRED